MLDKNLENIYQVYVCVCTVRFAHSKKRKNFKTLSRKTQEKLFKVGR